MGYHVTAEVFEHSRQKGGKLLILLAIAETAHNADGVAFGIDQGWTRDSTPRRQRETIAGKARLRPETVSRLVAELAGAHDDEIEIRWVQDGQARTALYRILVGSYRSRDVDYDRLTRYRQTPNRLFSTPAELARDWSKRPGSDAHGAPELPDEMSGSPEGDCLTSDQVPPDISSGDHLTSTDGDTSYTRTRVVQEPVLIRPAAGTSSNGSLDAEEQEGLGEPAAAEAPSFDEISDVVDGLRGADAGSARMVERDAVGLSRQAFGEEVAKLRARCRTGEVTNPVGLLRKLLRARRGEAIAAQTVFAPTRLTVVSPRQSDQVLRDAPELYIRQLADVLDDDELRARLAEHHHADRIDGYLALAADVRAGRIEPAEPETPEQARARWVTDKASNPEFPLDEIHTVVDAWDGIDLDDVERQQLHDRADEIRAALERPNAGREAAA